MFHKRFLAVVAKFFHFRAWRKAAGPEGEHWHRHHDHKPPRCWGDEKPFEKASDEAEPDAGTGEAAAES